MNFCNLAFVLTVVCMKNRMLDVNLCTYQHKTAEICDFMAEIYLNLAGRTVGVTTLYADTARYCENYMPNSTDSNDAEFSVTITQADIDLERIKSARQDECEGIPVRKFSDSFLELTAVQQKSCR